MLTRVIFRVSVIAVCGCLGTAGPLSAKNSVNTVGSQVQAPAIEANIRVVPLLVNDLIYDPWNQTIYASVPSRAGTYGNSVVLINPETGALVKTIPVGTEPRRMALSDDGQFLYVGLDGEGAIRRIDIASQSAGLRFPLSSSAQLIANSISVMPGQPRSIAVSRRELHCCPSLQGVAIYDDGVARTKETSYLSSYSSQVMFSSIPTTLFDGGNFVYKLIADQDGATSVGGSVGGNPPMRYDHGLVYSSDGAVIDPEAGVIKNRFPLPTYPNDGDLQPAPQMVALESEKRRAYFLLTEIKSTFPWEPLLTITHIDAFDMDTLQPLGAAGFPDVRTTYGADSFVRWGKSGLAFAANGSIFLIKSSVVDPSLPVSNQVSFSSTTYSVTEGDTAFIRIQRLGDVSNSTTVEYSTSDGSATQRSDYTPASGKLTFAPNETYEFFSVLTTDNAFVDGNRTVNITLSNSSGELASPSAAVLTITDNDSSGPTTTPLSDTRLFVEQQYHDFLNRDPDYNGWNFWTNNINQCIPQPACMAVQRVNTSAAFFLSIEFQQTGYLVERMYKTAYGNLPNAPVPIRFGEFLPDTQQIGSGVVVGQTGWETVLENNKQAFANEFVQRARFTAALPTSMTPAQFVDALNANAGNVLSSSERASTIALFGGAASTTNTTARTQALRQVAESQNLYNAEFNRAFVLMQYFGYLRRNPNDAPDSDFSGYNFWLTKLNQFGGNYQAAEMVKAFITSSEYRQRFGP
jgi:hypothetical protein